MSEECIPQLRMIIRDLRSWSPPPLPPLPDGYVLRTSQPGDDQAWCTIISEAFGQELTLAAWQREIIEKEGYRPERVFIIFEGKSGEPAATASAMRAGGKAHGYLHFVGTRPICTGHKLGYLASAAATRSFKDAGCVDAILDTDPWRIPAITTYLKMGYRPLLRHPRHVEIWHELRLQLKLDFEI